jgi:hypothetical protein
MIPPVDQTHNTVLTASSAASIRMMCRGWPSACASGSGFSTFLPMIGSTISANFAGWAVARKIPARPTRPA